VNARFCRREGAHAPLCSGKCGGQQPAGGPPLPVQFGGAAGSYQLLQVVTERDAISRTGCAHCRLIEIEADVAGLP
jgi:hypothetical protein